MKIHKKNPLSTMNKLHFITLLITQVGKPLDVTQKLFNLHLINE
jgi:hypothetical protein